MTTQIRFVLKFVKSWQGIKGCSYILLKTDKGATGGIILDPLASPPGANNIQTPIPHQMESNTQTRFFIIILKMMTQRMS